VDTVSSALLKPYRMPSVNNEGVVTPISQTQGELRLGTQPTGTTSTTLNGKSVRQKLGKG